eukprot:gene4717-3408_t
MLAEPRSSVIAGGRRHITSKYTDGAEVYEEYDTITDDLLLRRRREKNKLGGMTDWVVEIGNEKLDGERSNKANVLQGLIAEASGAPELVRQDTKEAHVFRIRNLPYPREVYQISVEGASTAGGTTGTGEPAKVGEIVVRTTNKKYFKRIDIPDMQRAGIPLDPSHLSFDVKHNTLIITYRKHLAILTAEAAMRKERLSTPATRKEDQQQCAAHGARATQVERLLLLQWLKGHLLLSVFFYARDWRGANTVMMRSLLTVRGTERLPSTSQKELEGKS